ncbi:hypothetical protein CJF42_24545 [Pseudoalteromonas sp. NBT06-2]|uniref:HEPN domain-containing protein n=1 Tax=Pseudoalteromonas sp. NBT06-2 TaxID=2025950 RepID=UPI000BA650D2|nr:HEPN domain-containing protein [Pseudoalteromonas sp. NBT06-2]PAJ71832.1 hypothetical protein CJF42_24545 [Pseudoalteromonas sp. NBT06-2]
MACTEQYQINNQLLDDLIELAKETKIKSLDDGCDDFFTENVNFFSKSYMVLMCAYLEAYIKSVSKHYISEISCKINEYKIPSNLLKWSIQKEKFKVDNEKDCLKLNVSISANDIDKNVSANPYTTAPFFIRLGIDLNKNSNYSDLSDLVETIVNKRNSIVHHNDNATDITFDDVILNAAKLKDYIKLVDEEIIKAMNDIT